LPAKEQSLLILATSHHTKRRLDRVKEVVTEPSLCHYADGAMPEGVSANVRIIIRRYEHDGNMEATIQQVPLQLKTVHPWHLDVKNETVDAADTLGGEKRFGARKCHGVHSRCVNKTEHGRPKRLVIIDDGDPPWQKRRQDQ
jgi:hypothetical protein